jgi:pimeloyl-ACP methyl ester carboxylesterase
MRSNMGSLREVNASQANAWIDHTLAIGRCARQGTVHIAVPGRRGTRPRRPSFRAVATARAYTVAMTSSGPSPALQQWLAAQQFVAVAGRRIAFRRSFDVPGARPCLILIHGFPTAGFDWAESWTALSHDFDLIAPDLLGFGASAKPRGHDYRLVEQADLVAAVAAACGVRRAHLLAHDYGDSVAQELLARTTLASPGELALESVIFLNGGLFPEVHRARLIQTLLASPLGPLLARLLDRERYGRSLAAVFAPGRQPSAQQLEDFWHLTALADGHRIAHRLLRYLAERRQRRERWVSAMQSTRTPLRFINGSLDPISGAHMAARYRELIPDPDVVALDDVGHYPQVEAPAQVLAACRDFWRRIGAL